MPHINRIRVNNVKYNFGTQFYDDFIMRFSGKNTIYDLANGGGKSVLMLLLLQNLIPNCTLDEKQPIEKLFRGDGSQVIHSLIEWKLNKNNIKDGFRYMTTGFCARKAKESATEDTVNGKENAAIEYFNYCIFYREFNDNDLRNLPLSNGKERITYQGLRNHLRDLEKKDYGLQVKIFDRKGDYQRFISQYGLYESEWEIIRGINKTEGHVRTYFESHYKTTRKVVEDLLIEEIIQKSFQNKIGTEGDSQEIAQTLLDIKDKLVDLSKKKGEMNHYDLQMEVLDSFIQRLQTMKGVYLEKGGLEEELLKTYKTAIARMDFKKEQLAKATEQEESLLEEQKHVQKQVECAQIQSEEADLVRLEEESARTKKLLAQHEENRKAIEEQLKKEESGNDYLDYIEDKKRLEIQEEVMKAVMQEKEGLLTELYRLVSAIKKKSAKEQERLGREVETARSEQEEKEAQVQALQEKIQKNACEKAVLQSRLNENEQDKRQVAAKLSEIQKITGVLLEVHVKEALNENRHNQGNLQSQKTRLEAEKKECEEVFANTNQELLHKEQQKNLAKERQEQVKKYLDQYSNQRKQAEHLREIYKEHDYGRIRDKIFASLKEQLEKRSRLLADIEECKALLGALEGKVPMVISQKTRQLAEYISRHHDTKVILGAEYIAGKEGFEKDLLLEQFPMLPYGILVEKNFHQVVDDVHILRTDYGNTPIPVLSMEALSLEEGLKQEKYLHFVGKETELFLEETRQATLLEETGTTLAEKETKLEKYAEVEGVLREDYDFISRFAKDYGKKLQEIQGDYEENKVLLERLEKEEELLYITKEKTKENQKKIEENLLRLEGELKTALEEEKLYVEMQDLLGIQTKLNLKEETLQKDLLTVTQAGEEIKLSQGALQEALRNSLKTLQILQDKKHTMERDWELLYGAYDKPGYEADYGMGLEELEIHFKGRKEAFEKENGDVEDKKLLVENLKASMERALRSIEYRGYSMEDLEKMYKENQLQRTHTEQLLARRKQVEECKEAEELAQRTYQGQTESLNRKFGGISHAKTMVEERFGDFSPVVLEGVTFADFLAANKTRLKNMDEKIKETKVAAKELERQCFALESMCSDMERMMKQVGMNKDAHLEDLWEHQVSLKEKYQELRDRYDQLAREEQRRREGFEKDKAKLIESLQKLNAHAFAEELKSTMINPTGYEQVERLISGLSEAVSYIELEKSRVGKGIEDMEIIKNNFENQCLQTCLTIKAELEKLPGMSNIQLDDQPVPMIQLSIPYIREDQYKEAMAAYIDKIVENTEGFSKPEERLRYIRNQLAFKHLFSVIVKDMNAIKLTLYKRERIKEQSRYLKYEEAVGSTGQSQGIYIQFLIAIIHYITSIHSNNADPLALKNVIFIDNPFGAAKDVYIWEPIFKLLKSNNVQLIVPARGATPAITGRFEVNYILGQKLADGKQQTVVIDYRSQTEEEEIEYKPLNFEQSTLF